MRGRGQDLAAREVTIDIDLGACVWSEDDACRAYGDDSRERIEAAWVKTFGVAKPERVSALAYHDLGDCFAWVYEDGRIELSSFDGEHIHAQNVVDLRRYRQERLAR